MYRDNDIYINGKYYNTLEVLDINDNIEFEIVKLNSIYSVLYIDNFYTNPDLVREISLSLPATKKLNIGFPGFRSELTIEMKNFINSMDSIIKYNFDIRKDIKINWETYNQSLTFNILKSSKEWDWHIGEEYQPQCQPHIDGYSIWASLCYLNKDNEYKGKAGTGIYRNKFTDSISHSTKMFDDSKLFKSIYSGFGCTDQNDLLWREEGVGNETVQKSCNEWIKDENEYWKLEHLIEMKYNRMVIYPGNLFHSIYMGNKNDFIDNVRITQPAFFIYGK